MKTCKADLLGKQLEDENPYSFLRTDLKFWLVAQEKYVYSLQLQVIL